MKLVFNKSPQGLELAYVECTSTQEADEFQSWFHGKLTPAQPKPATPEETMVFESQESTQEIFVPAKKVERNEVSQAAIALVQTKGRVALNPILERYSAKRISEIAEDQLGAALADIKEAQQ